MLVPCLDAFEWLGEAVRHVIALRDVDGGDLIMRDAVFDDVDAAERPHGAANRTEPVSLGCRRRWPTTSRGRAAWDAAAG